MCEVVQLTFQSPSGSQALLAYVGVNPITVSEVVSIPIGKSGPFSRKHLPGISGFNHVSIPIGKSGPFSLA